VAAELITVLSIIHDGHPTLVDITSENIIPNEKLYSSSYSIMYTTVVVHTNLKWLVTYKLFIQF